MLGESYRSGMTRSLADSFRYAFRGVLYALRTQPNIRIHLAVALLVVVAAVWLGVSPPEVALLVLAIGLVLVSEMVNTAVETLLDALAPGYHALVGAAKDVSAGAVLVSAVGAVLVGLAVLGPPLLRRLGL